MPHPVRWLRVRVVGTLLVLGALFTARAAAAARFDVPPVIISRLDHKTFYWASDQTYDIFDGVQFPSGAPASTGYTSAGFTANLAGYDHIRIRFEAAPGLKFVVHALQPGQTFSFYAYWQDFDFGDYIHDAQAGMLTFENGAGAVPTTQTYVDDAVSDESVAIVTHHEVPVTGEFEFTAIQVDFPIGHVPVSVTRNYSSVYGYSSPSFGSGAHLKADQPVMELVSTLPTAAHASTWGHLKALYH